MAVRHLTFKRMEMIPKARTSVYPQCGFAVKVCSLCRGHCAPFRCLGCCSHPWKVCRWIPGFPWGRNARVCHESPWNLAEKFPQIPWEVPLQFHAKFPHFQFFAGSSLEILRSLLTSGSASRKFRFKAKVSWKENTVRPLLVPEFLLFGRHNDVLIGFPRARLTPIRQLPPESGRCFCDASCLGVLVGWGLLKAGCAMSRRYVSRFARLQVLYLHASYRREPEVCKSTMNCS